MEVEGRSDRNLKHGKAGEGQEVTDYIYMIGVLVLLHLL